MVVLINKLDFHKISHMVGFLVASHIYALCIMTVPLKAKHCPRESFLPVDLHVHYVSESIVCKVPVKSSSESSRWCTCFFQNNLRFSCWPPDLLRQSQIKVVYFKRYYFVPTFGVQVSHSCYYCSTHVVHGCIARKGVPYYWARLLAL